MRFPGRLFSQFALLALFSLAASAQRPPYQSPPRPPQAAPPPSPAPTPIEIHVDQRCRILPTTPALPSGKKARPSFDWTVCHLENVFDTHHRVQTVVGSELQRSDVEIFEQQYVLGNPTQQPEVFIIEQPAVKGWTIEGDPPPFRVVAGKEYYRAWVQPGEAVRLHVGMRQVTPLKAKALRASAKGASPPPPTGPPPVAPAPPGAPNAP
ncbi:MAG TPA: hypothetical protein VME68_08350 [Acidobacteriaceae bacterium]|nr:hypothetical protein [Acidobacteriaceae bacterium]